MQTQLYVHCTYSKIIYLEEFLFRPKYNPFMTLPNEQWDIDNNCKITQTVILYSNNTVFVCYYTCW